MKDTLNVFLNGIGSFTVAQKTLFPKRTISSRHEFLQGQTETLLKHP